MLLPIEFPSSTTLPMGGEIFFQSNIQINSEDTDGGLIECVAIAFSKFSIEIRGIIFIFSSMTGMFC